MNASHAKRKCRSFGQQVCREVKRRARMKGAIKELIEKRKKKRRDRGDAKHSAVCTKKKFWVSDV